MLQENITLTILLRVGLYQEHLVEKCFAAFLEYRVFELRELF